MKKLKKFNMTRFVNTVHFVFVICQVEYSVVRLALVNLTVSKKNNSALKGRSKTEAVNYVSRKLTIEFVVSVFQSTLPSSSSSPT